MHQKKAVEVDDNMELLKEFLHSPEEVLNVLQWLDRVRVRMTSSTSEIPVTKEDRIYLSRFEMSRVCDGKILSNWTEWIEPLTLTSRHPFGLLHPIPLPGYDAGRVNADYLLFDNVFNFKSHGRDKGKAFMIDAGASQSYEVSTNYFVCAYSQRGIQMDRIYSYEYRKYDPERWWASVPSNLIDKVNFRNVPVSSNHESVHNPLNMIKTMTKPHDYVAFKLDIDSSHIEIPLIIDLLSDVESLKLVDELFFEFHYNCPLMKKINFYKAPSGYEDKIEMSRVGSLKLFSDLRYKGIRAHYWV